MSKKTKENQTNNNEISGLLKNISHFKDVIRKVDIISEATKKTKYQNEATIDFISRENEKRFNTLQSQINNLSTKDKLDRTLEVLYANFDIVNRNMETNNLLISEMGDYLKKTRNTLFALLKSTELLLENKKETESK